MSLKDKAVGHDKISSFFLKAAKEVITPYLTLFIEYMFTEGIFPRSCKIARIAPILISGAKDEAGNYRPISILTCFSKIIEKLIYVRFFNFFKKHDVVYAHQYAFQKNVSTANAILDVVTSTHENISDDFYTGLAMVDLKKAFDTMSHSTLMLKLNHYGIRGVASKLIYSYLQNRKQFVKINRSCSDKQIIDYGVPQGSSLGPLFFLVYVNDMSNALASKPILFADDTCLLVKASNLESLQTNLDIELQNLHEWCCINKLTINHSKTSVLIIPPKLGKNHPPYLSVNRNGSPIKVEHTLKYLGVIMDDKLTFGDHIKILVNKVARGVGILTKLKHFFPQNILLQLHYTLVHSQLLYGIIIWGNTFPTYMRKLTALQNRAVKISPEHIFGIPLNLYMFNIKYCKLMTSINLK